MQKKTKSQIERELREIVTNPHYLPGIDLVACGDLQRYRKLTKQLEGK